MPIRSLTDLNNYSLTTITYTDTRPARVYFDRGAPQDQTLSINENQTYVFPWGINIEDITQYDVALVVYEIDLSNFSTATSVTWDYFPPHCSVSVNNNIYTISGIQNRADWDFVKQARVQAPFGFTGLSPQTGTISYYEDSAATTRTVITWDADITFVAVEYLSDPPTLTYTSNEIKNNISTTEIIADTDEFDPTWTLEITSSVPSAIASMDATANGSGTVSYDSGNKKLTLTGDKTDMNVQLQSIDISFAQSDADLNLQFLLRNSYTTTTEYIVQTVESRDFIVDASITSTANISASAIYRSPSNPIMRVTTNITGYRDAQLLPTEITSISNLDIDPTLIYDPTLNFSVESSWYYPYYWFEGEIISSVEFDGIIAEDFYSGDQNTIASANGYTIIGDTTVSSSSGNAKIIQNSTKSVLNTLSNPNDYGVATNDQFGVDVGISSTQVIVGAHLEDEATGNNSGKAYIFNRSTGNLVYTLDNPNAYGGVTDDRFGWSVAISDDYAIVGAHFETGDGLTDSRTVGAAYIYDTSTGSLLHEIVNPSVPFAENGFYGDAVDITDTHALVGEPDGLVNGNRVGLAHVYDPSDGSKTHTWASPYNAIGDEFGTCLALNDTHALIGAPGVATDTGRVYMYNLSTGSLVHTFTNPTGQANYRFGDHVAMTNDYIAIAMPSTFANTGLVYVYNTSYELLHKIDVYGIDTSRTVRNSSSGQRALSIDGDDLFIATLQDVYKIYIG